MVFKRKKKEEVVEQAVESKGVFTAPVTEKYIFDVTAGDNIQISNVLTGTIGPDPDWVAIIEIVRELYAKCLSGDITSNDKIYNSIQYLYKKYGR
jgi:hypothetical protein